VSTSPTSPTSPAFGGAHAFGSGPPRARPKIAQAIIDDIRASIASGELELGSRLPNERELARHFGVSQPTVREAVRALDAMGLVEVKHGSGVFVAANVHDFVFTTLNMLLQVQQVGVFDVLQIREVLGEYSAARAATEASEGAVATIAAAEELCRAADSVEATAQAVIAFQAACSAAARNPLLFALETFLIKITMQLQVMAEGGRGPAFWKAQTDRFDEHRTQLLERIRAHDEQGAVAAMKAYLGEQRAWFSADAQMSTVSLSDPHLVRAINEILIDVPHYPMA
jgi:GntR family transcriptional repressor for pyruvate dehydrogenase complex